MNILPKNTEKTVVGMIYIALVFAAVYFVLPKIIVYIMPFIVGYILTKMMIPISDFLHEKCKLPKKFAIIIVMLLLVGIIFSIVFMLVYEAAYEIQKISRVIPKLLYGEIDLPQWAEHVKNFYLTLPMPVQEFCTMVVNNVKDNISEIVRPATQAVISVATNVATVLPNIIVFTVVAILSAYFICSDRENIRNFAKNSLPKSITRRAIYIKHELFRACGGYLKAQGILMCVTFFVVLLSLAVLKVDAAVLLAFIIALVDAVPILGTGTILVPWAVVCLVSGKYFLAIGLLIVYAITFLIRRFAEPKIVSSQIGLHPLVTLASIYIGLKAVGVFGMILGPIVAMIIINFFKAEEKYKQEIEMN